MINDVGFFPEAKRYSDEVEVLLLAARRLSKSLRLGEHGRRTSGAGSDFWQFRKFENGLDSPRSINWKQSAKSDELYVRETEWSAPQTLSIIVDRDGDHFIDHPKSKAYFNALITMALGYAYCDISEKVRVECGEFLQVDRPKEQIEIADTLLQPSDHPLRLPIAQDIPRNSKALILSSYFQGHEGLAQHLSTFGERGITGCLVQVLTQDELNFPFSGRVEFKSASGSIKFQSNQARALRLEYLDKLAKNQKSLAEIAAANDWIYLNVSIEQDPREIIGLIIGHLGMH